MELRGLALQWRYRQGALGWAGAAAPQVSCTPVPGPQQVLGEGLPWLRGAWCAAPFLGMTIAGLKPS